MKIHILGACGTFMGGIAVLAQEQGHEVSGCDTKIYPPMSSALRQAGIKINEGYSPSHIPDNVDQIIVGNVIRRGNPELEFVLNQSLSYTSGPQWLAENVLKNRFVLAVSGTHGKTTTSSLLTWILQDSGLNPGYLIGGIANNFKSTASLGKAPYFVIEADEYDTAFFDKRSKFLHYRPRLLIINNLEFDHADIFENLSAIKKQFSFLLRTVPSNGLIIYPKANQSLQSLTQEAGWTPTQTVGLHQGDWQIKAIKEKQTGFTFEYLNKKYLVESGLYGLHNFYNIIAAIAAAHQIGLPINNILHTLKKFKGVKRRLEIYGKANNITLYDDFAHHPTAIEATLKGLRARVGHERIIAVLQFTSYTMRSGCHEKTLAHALKTADQAILLKSKEQQWTPDTIVKQLKHASLHHSIDEILNKMISILKPNDHVLIMSNQNFDELPKRLLNQLNHSPRSAT